MFCPFCDRQIKDNSLFCRFCGKALPQKNTPFQVNQPTPQVNVYPQTFSPRKRLSSNAKKGIITGILIVALIVVILLLYYPNVFPWNW